MGIFKFKLRKCIPCFIIGAGLLLTFLLQAGSDKVRKFIILEVGDNRMELQSHAIDAEKYLGSVRIQGLTGDKGGIRVKVIPFDSSYMLVTGPFTSEESLISAFFHVKKVFPSASLIPSNDKIGTVFKEEGGERGFMGIESRTLAIVISIAGVIIIALIGGLIYYFSSRKVKNIFKEHEEILEKQEEIERRQHELFSDLGENIYNMSKDVVLYTKSAISEIGNDDASKTLCNVMNTENRILDVTKNLLRFLKLKAKKATVHEEVFNINNLFDDVVGGLSSQFRGTPIELIFDLEHNLPKMVIGDFTYLGEVFGNLLEHSFTQMEEGVISFEANAYVVYDERIDLIVKIRQVGRMKSEPSTLEEYFTPYYDEYSGEYKRLGLFVAHELVKLMKGNITMQVLSPDERVLNVSIPLYEVYGERRRKYPLPTEELTKKEVYVVNRNYHASMAIKNLFAYFKHNVIADTEERYRSYREDLGRYDIVLIEETLVDTDFAQRIREIRRHKDIKVIGLSSIFDISSVELWPSLFNARIKKPLTQERVFMLILDLYRGDSEPEPIAEEAESAAIERKSQFIRNVKATDGVGIGSFRDFEGARLLVVEDNEINLKMLLKILSRSGMQIDTAHNGRDALEKIQRRGGGAYDLVLMDINMPIMDGYTSTIRIRELEDTKNLPIVALTALVLESEVDRMQDCGMDAFLPKPLNIGKLYTVFKKYLGEDSEEDHEERAETVPFVEILDLRLGLQHTDNNPIFYQELLEEFLNVYKGAGERAGKLLEEEKYDLLRQLNLDIMGLAGSLGATRLYHACLMVHRVFEYNKLPLLPHYVNNFMVEMDRAEDAMLKYLSTRNGD